MKRRQNRRANRKIPAILIVLFAVSLIGVFLNSNSRQSDLQASVTNSSNGSFGGSIDNNPIATDQLPSETPPRIIEAEAMQQIYSDFYGPSTDTTLGYLKRLAGLGWNSSAFLAVMNGSMELAGAKMMALNSERAQPVYFNIGVGEAQHPEYAVTQAYRQNGHYGVIIWLHLEQSAAAKPPAEFWSRDYGYPVAHEMRHVKRIFDSGLFDGHQASDDIGSSELFSEYLNNILKEHDIPAEFNTTSTAKEIDELGVVLETDNPKEIALNIDRINSLTIDLLTNDESLGAPTVAPPYMGQIVLAHYLRQAYAKPSVQRLNYSIRDSAFDEMDNLSTAFRNELYRAYSNETEAMQRIEKIYEEEAKQAVMKNS